MTYSSDYICRDTDNLLDADNDQYVYGSAYADNFLLQNPESFPRFAPLARKALHHYAGDTYDPHKHGLTIELFVREIIQEIVSYKVLYKTQAYDWEWIDNVLKKYIGGCLKLNLPYDQLRIDAAFTPDCRATALTNDTLPH